jgi:hypothetical protein
MLLVIGFGFLALFIFGFELFSLHWLYRSLFNITFFAIFSLFLGAISEDLLML